MKALVSRLLTFGPELALIGLTRAVFALSRSLGPDRAGDAGAALVRHVGRFLPAHRTGLSNLRMVFPEKTEEERAHILSEAWGNLGRVAAEYAHLSTLFDYDAQTDQGDRTQVEGIEHFLKLRDDGKPGLIFSAHLANWEFPAICAARYGLDATAVFRAPNNAAIRRVIAEIRGATMGNLEAARQGAAFAMQGVLERGGHLGMLIDQHFTRGVPVTFMGHQAMVNPLLAKFARAFECPVHGVRVIRLDKARFKLELTPPLTLPRNDKGEIDVQGSMQMMTDVVESWVRENPEQWLWMHRRWRQTRAI